ncbi:MAG: hypothetical protein R2827_03790 [Bdellovibrionales bacterium]
MEKYPLVIGYRIALANLLLRADRYRDAIVAFKVLQIENKLKEAHLGLGKAYKGLGEVQAALDAFLNGAAVDPGDAGLCLSRVFSTCRLENTPWLSSLTVL